jgi:hypothetical protein
MQRARVVGGEDCALGQNGSRWWITLPEAREELFIALELLGTPKLPSESGPLRPNAKGEVILPAHEATVTGTKLCYEPQPHKNTLGYWVNPADWASWEIELSEPGTFDVTVLQGCGTGHGGSDVDVLVGGTRLSFVVEDTGHFQNFKSRPIGTAELAAGRHRVEIRPRRLAKGAVMDVREVRLTPTK